MSKLIQNGLSWVFERLNLLANLATENLALRHQIVVHKENSTCKWTSLWGKGQLV